MNLQEKKNELEEKFGAEVSNLSERFDKEIRELKLEVEQEENQEWVPKFGETYFYIDLDAMITQTSTWLAATNDTIRLEHKVIFKTEAESEEYLEYLKAKERAMNEFSDEEWKDSSIIKKYIGYGYVDKEFYVSSCFFNRELNVMYFRDGEQAKEFIKKYEKFMRRELDV